jgi:hypothetical protein
MGITKEKLIKAMFYIYFVGFAFTMYRFTNLSLERPAIEIHNFHDFKEALLVIPMGSAGLMIKSVFGNDTIEYAWLYVLTFLFGPFIGLSLIKDEGKWLEGLTMILAVGMSGSYFFTLSFFNIGAIICTLLIGPIALFMFVGLTLVAMVAGGGGGGK